MRHPSRGQWIVIWTGFAVASWWFLWASKYSWSGGSLSLSIRDAIGVQSSDEFRALACITIVATALLVWWLESRRKPPKSN
jgi:hypothetical protein